MLSTNIGFVSVSGGKRPRKFKVIRLGIFLIILFSITLLSACASEDSKPAGEDENVLTVNEPDLEEDYVRSNEGNGVWIDVTWTNPPGSDDSEGLQNESLVFIIAKTTHEGDLLSYDLEANTRLIIDGEPVELDSNWELVAKDSHHPVGTLIFDLTGSEQPLSSVTLVMAGLADVAERNFHWELAR